MKTRRALLIIALGVGLNLTLALLGLLSRPAQPARAGPGTLCVAPGGSGCDPVVCGGTCYASVQDAVDAAVPGDEIRVAAGTYTGVNNYGGLAQMVYISKTVTIRGGYIATNWTTPYPITQTTTLDAQRQGRVLYITGNISPTIEGLHITGGEGSWRGGGGVYLKNSAGTFNDNIVYANTADHGGGVYLINSDATLNGNTINSNTAESEGGGLHLYGSNAMINGNSIISNTAGYGGGLHLNESDATLNGNTINSNTAECAGGGLYLSRSGAALSGNTVYANSADSGGGLRLHDSDATVSGNAIHANTADCNGGGLYLSWSGAALSGNAVYDNTAGQDGGGLYLYGSDSTFSGNAVYANTANRDGGGAYLTSHDTLSGNTIISNTASQRGGGLCLSWGTATLRGNTVASNTANSGGGVYLENSQATLTNNVVVDNRANNVGSGLYIRGFLPPHLLHTTIARNSGGDGSGVYVTDEDGGYSTVAMTNTILVSHSVGITVTAGTTATLDATLWGSGAWANGSDWGGAGTIFTGTVNIWGNPAFVDPDARDYHIGGGSAAVDAGVETNVADDIDGEPRPTGHGYDLGADELRIALTITKQTTPDAVQAGDQLTYTIRLTNTGKVTLTATITDVLPDHVTPTGPLTWTPPALAPDDIWTDQFTVTVQMGYAGTLTNVVQVTTQEGATDVYTATSLSLAPQLEVTKQAKPDPVEPGTQLTYTIRLTNTGTVTLTATITDTRPISVTPSGLLTWTPPALAPDDVWTDQFTVTVDISYTGTLTNVVEVTTEEGARGGYTHTVETRQPRTDIYLPIILRNYKP